MNLKEPITSLDIGGADDIVGYTPQLPILGRSHVRGKSDIPLLHKTIPEFFADARIRFGSRDAAVFCEHDVRWTYEQLAEQIDNLAAALLAAGIEPGERVGIWSPNRPEWLVTQFATARIGTVLVNINPAYQLFELEYALTKVSCKALVTAVSFKASMYVQMLQDLAPELAHCAPGKLVAEKLPHLRTVIHTGASDTPGMFRYKDFVGMAGPAHRNRLDQISRSLNPHQPINIQFTSGTTGSPKGATLTHANIINNGRFIGQAMHLSEYDRLCIPVPLYHCFGMVLGNLACVSAGSAMIYPGEGFEPHTTLAAVAAEKCTALHGVPTMFMAILDHPEFARYDLSKLRTGIMAGAPCPIEVMRKVIDRMHMREITIAYGMTETSPVSFQSATDDPIEKRVATVGRIHPHVEVKIVDDKGEIVPLNQRAELCTKGYSVMKGYWGDDQLTAETIDPEGWMHTGDLAIIDDLGYCDIVGRVKDMLIRGGENVYPREIEEFLFTHPKVQQAEVFGVPDPKYGEEICTWICLHESEQATAEEIREFCKGKIAHFKIPRYIKFVAEIPMTVSGKPQKFKMRSMMVEELGLAEERD